MGNQTGRGTPWPLEKSQRLDALWAERDANGKALSTAAIGRAMGITKNAVIGAAHRLGLPARPSPIKAAVGAEASPRRGSRPMVSRLPILASLAVAVDVPPVAPVPETAVRPVHLAAPLVVSAPAQASPSPELVDEAPRAVFLARKSSDCCWPIGEPGTREFRFCDAVSEPGRPYCGDHCRIAYARVREAPPAVAMGGGAHGWR